MTAAPKLAKSLARADAHVSRAIGHLNLAVASLREAGLTQASRAMETAAFDVAKAILEAGAEVRALPTPGDQP